MKRLSIFTVGKTHSGKSTFARELERNLLNSIVIDQDNHAEFINRFYKSLVPVNKENNLKKAISETIVDYAIEQTDLNLIFCNSNLVQKNRLELIKQFNEKNFISILVYFDIPDSILVKRIANSRRSTDILRSASSFEELLTRQLNQFKSSEDTITMSNEAEYFFIIKESSEVQFIINKIVNISKGFDDH